MLELVRDQRRYVVAFPSHLPVLSVQSRWLSGSKIHRSGPKSGPCRYQICLQPPAQADPTGPIALRDLADAAIGRLNLVTESDLGLLVEALKCHGQRSFARSADKLGLPASAAAADCLALSPDDGARFRPFAPFLRPSTHPGIIWPWREFHSW
jgi:hypothetical protein